MVENIVMDADDFGAGNKERLRLHAVLYSFGAKTKEKISVNYCTPTSLYAS